MRPGPTTLRLLVWLAGAALVVSVVPAFVWGVLAGLAALVAAAIFEAWRLRSVTLVVDGWSNRVLSLGESDEGALTIRSTAARPLRLRVRQLWPALLADRSAVREAVLQPHESLDLRFPVRGLRRGRETLSPPHLAFSFWGLAERRAQAGTPAELRVFPDLRQVGRLHARLNQLTLRGLGNRMSARLGKGREFDRLREYVTGDEFRDISWKASARRGKLIAREHRLDRSQDILICLDHGHRMAARVAELTRLDHAVNAAATLAYVCNRMEDRTGVIAFSDEAEVGPPLGRGPAHLARLTDFVASLGASYRHTDYPALSAAASRMLRRRGLVIVFTTLPELAADPLLRSVRALGRTHLVLVVALLDVDLVAAARLRPRTRGELSRTLVAQDLVLARERMARELRGAGAMVVETRPGDAAVAAMNAYIEVKRRQLL